MYIAICEDCAEERRHAAELIERYAAAHGLQLRIQQFADGEALLKAAGNEHFTHYFLDVMMPGMDGISLAEEIRAIDGDAGLVFITAFKEYAYRSYRLHALDYLLKPVNEKQIAELMSRLRSMEENSRDCLSVESGRSIFRIPYSKLTCLEINRKKLFLHLSDGQPRQIYGALSDYENELLSRREFVKIHRSYIVNLGHISELSPDGCVMFGGKSLPVSRLMFNHVREEYIRYLFGGDDIP